MKKLIVAVAFAASAAFAENKPAAAPAAAAAPAKMEMPKPAPEMSVEQWFVGNWDCKGQQHAGPMGPEMKTHNKVEFKMELGGFWMQVHVTALSGPMKGMEFVDAFAGWDGTQHQRWDFMPGGMAHLTAKGWDGDKIVFDGDSMMGPQKAAMRHTMTKKGDNEMTGAFEMAGPDGKMAPMVEETCTRAAKAAAKK